MLEPWLGFFRDLDGAVAHDVSLRCLGGFVMSVCHGMPRSTADIDVLSVVPNADTQALLALGGRESPLHKKHRVYLDLVTIATHPDSYEDRVTEAFPGLFTRLRIMILDPYDLALSKLERNAPHDRDDVFYLADTIPLDLAVLESRYRQEMRPYLGIPTRENLTIKLWIEAVTERRQRHR